MQEAAHIVRRGVGAGEEGTTYLGSVMMRTPAHSRIVVAVPTKNRLAFCASPPSPRGCACRLARQLRTRDDGPARRTLSADGGGSAESVACVGAASRYGARVSAGSSAMCGSVVMVRCEGVGRVSLSLSDAMVGPDDGVRAGRRLFGCATRSTPPSGEGPFLQLPPSPARSESCSQLLRGADLSYFVLHSPKPRRLERTLYACEHGVYIPLSLLAMVD
jgi:hypothetical protein